MYSICSSCNGRGIVGVRPIFTYPMGYAPPLYAEAMAQVGHGPVFEAPPPAYCPEWSTFQRRRFNGSGVSVPRQVDFCHPITEASFERALESIQETGDMERFVRYLYHVDTVPLGPCPVMKSWMLRALFRRCQTIYCSSYIMHLIQSWDIPGRRRTLNSIDTLLLMDIEDEWIRIDDEDDRIYVSETDDYDDYDPSVGLDMETARHIISDSEASVSEVDMDESYTCFYCGVENVPGDPWCCHVAQYGPVWNVWPLCSCRVCAAANLESSDTCLRYDRLGYLNGRPVQGPVPEDVDMDDALRDFVIPELDDGTVAAADRAFGQMIQNEFDQDTAAASSSVVRRLLFD